MARREKILKKMLCNTIRILENNGIPYWLESGTLLGLVRDRNLFWHKDIDIAIPGTFFEKFSSLKKRFAPKYRFIEKLDRSGRRWIESNITRIKILRSWEKNRSKSLKINITIKYKKNDKYSWIDKRNCKWVSSHFFDTLDKIDVGGIEFYIPSDVENYLKQRYGEWKVPQENWIGSIDDFSIVEDNIIKKIPMRTIIKNHNFKRIKLEGKYLLNMKRMIFDTLDILEKHNIKYWFDDGTLLGIIRDDDLIPWDHDADFGVSGEYAQEVLNLWNKFFPKYLMRKRITKSYWLPGKLRSVKIKTPWEKFRKINFHIDLFFYYKVNNSYHWKDSGTFKHIDRKFYDKLDTIIWEGRKIPIPSYVEEYLAFRYGDWKTPDPKFDPSIQDGAIAEKGF